MVISEIVSIPALGESVITGGRVPHDRGPGFAPDGDGSELPGRPGRQPDPATAFGQHLAVGALRADDGP